MKLSELSNRGAVAVKLSNEFFAQINLYNKTLKDDKIIIIDAQNFSHSKNVSIGYFNPTKNTRHTATMSGDLEVELLKGEERQALIQQYYNAAMKNLMAIIGYGPSHIGSDPEIFVQDSEKKQVIPAFEFLGSKDKPSFGKEDKNMHSYLNKVYWDGFQAEFDTKADTCLGWHTDSVRQGLKAVYDLAKKHNPKAVLSHITTMDIPQEMLAKAKTEHVEFGCMPSMNAYGHEGLKADGRSVDFRSAGGHIHFGIKMTPEAAPRMVKALDAILGVACVSLFEGYDDPKRRTMYGLAGEYRLPPHGLEYRTLSNAWLMHPLLMNMVFDLSRAALRVGKSGLLGLWDATEEETINCINNCDVALARTILKRNATLFRQIVMVGYRTYEDDQKTDCAVKIFNEGVNAHFETPTDLEKNWSLKANKWVTHSNAAGNNMENATHNFLKNNKKVS